MSMGAAKPRLTDKRRVGGSRVRRQQLKGAGEHAAGAIVRGAGSIRLLGAVCRVLIPPPLPPAAPAVPHSLPSLSHNSLHCPASFADVMSCVAGAHARGGLQVNVTAPKGAEIMGNIVCSRPARVLVSFASDSPSRVDRRKLRQVSGRAFCCFAQCHAHTLTIAPTHARKHNTQKVVAEVAGVELESVFVSLPSSPGKALPGTPVPTLSRSISQKSVTKSVGAGVGDESPVVLFEVMVDSSDHQACTLFPCHPLM